ncbi:MAG: tRNA (cytidine(34)-2'-O)-methyltransferase [bacterium]
MHIALINPEIPWNSGNIGRTCVATGTTLHFVGKLGFKIEDKEIRRSGLDYWPELEHRVHNKFTSLLSALPAGTPLIFFSTRAEKLYWDAPYTADSCLIFGSESKGLPDELRKKYAGNFYRIPVSDKVRSLNLSTAAAVALYEALRRTSLSS